MFDLTGKTALVTGASYGLGVLFAGALADAGADIVVTARSVDLLEAEAAKLREKGRKATVAPGDVTVAEDVERVIATAVAEHGRIDILVNNAGVSDLSGFPSEHFPLENFKKIIDTDLTGVWLFAQGVGRHMLEQGGGSIINIASILGEGGNEFVTAAYQAAKAGVIQLTKLLALEWGDRGVRVNAISPNYFVTDMVRPLFESVGLGPWIESRTPMRRMGELSDLVGPIVFLASDEAGYITGVNLPVDGGWNAGRGAWQLPPAHFSWNKKNPPIGEQYQGLIPFDKPEWRRGIPGMHDEV